MSGDFLSRWSRLKKEAAKPESPGPAEEAEPFADDSLAQASEPEASELEPLVDAADLSDAGPALSEEEIAALPPIEKLTGASDIAPFLRPGVPALLRKAALRQVWAIDPAIRDFVDDAREYAYDWNTPGGVPGLGPLLPSDDVKAMVRRIFDGPCPAAQAEMAEANHGKAIRDAEAAEEDAPESAEPSEIQPSIDSAESPAASPRPESAMAVSGDEARKNTPAEALDPSTAPRARRHGGATPV